MFFQSPWGVLTTFRSFQFVYLLSNGRKIRTRTPSIYALNINRHSSLASERQNWMPSNPQTLYRMSDSKPCSQTFMDFPCFSPCCPPPLKESSIFCFIGLRSPSGLAGLAFKGATNTNLWGILSHLHASFHQLFWLVLLDFFAKCVARQLELQKRSHSSQWIACCHHASVCSLVASSTQLAGQCKKTKEKKNGPRVIWIKCPGGVSWVLVQTIVFASVRRGKVCQSNNLEVKKSSWSWVEIMHHELSVLSLSGLSQDLAPDLRCNMASVVASWQNGSEQCSEGARISTNNSSSNNNNNNFRNNNNHHHHVH